MQSLELTRWYTPTWGRWFGVPAIKRPPRISDTHNLNKLKHFYIFYGNTQNWGRYNETMNGLVSSYYQSRSAFR